MNVLFLDYDGVVNTKMWDKEGKICRYNYPEDGSVNNFQSVQWVSEFCDRCGYSIVVTSTWAMHENYAECLRRGGLRDSIKILGKIDNYSTIEEKITAYLNKHPEIYKYIIFDDKRIKGKHSLKFVWCDSRVGFSERDYIKALKIHNRT
ncbi:MAG: hypothetical protein IJC94_02340 [Oscillospiraceae bacterium]|nr:hypothetical protein [Oscillospiraceae bacterium]